MLSLAVLQCVIWPIPVAISDPFRVYSVRSFRAVGFPLEGYLVF